MKAKLPEDEFINLFESVGAAELARTTGQTERGVHRRRVAIEKRRGIVLKPGKDGPIAAAPSGKARIHIPLGDAVVLAGSDPHYWPGPPSTAHRAFLKFLRDLSPSVVVLNGDVMDNHRISRFPPIGWEGTPTVAEELSAARLRLKEITDASPKARHIWPLGNHDARFETRLASIVPEFEGVPGVHLKDHFPLWEPCWAVELGDACVAKHRFKGGPHAPFHNTLFAGRSLITAHLHSLQVTPFSDYNGTRFGVDLGTLADLPGRQFVDYTEDNPANQRSGFVVLTFRGGRLLWPEVVHVIAKGQVEFRGKVITVGA